jgi:hypothetical protein
MKIKRNIFYLILPKTKAKKKKGKRKGKKNYMK